MCPRTLVDRKRKRLVNAVDVVERLRGPTDQVLNQEVTGAGLQTGARPELLQEENNVDDMVITKTLDEIYIKNVKESRGEKTEEKK